MRRGGFTLIELLVVVAVLSLLAALAVPNYLEAQVRAKTSAALAGQRTIATGLMAYRVDENRWPPTRTVLPDDPLALLAASQLHPLTTPVAYLSPGTFRDPFGGPRVYSKLQSVAVANPGTVDPNENLRNAEASMLYFHFPSTAERWQEPEIDRNGLALVAIGPDREDSLGAFSRHPTAVFRRLFSYAQLASPISTIYDPTNGSASSGDIVRMMGQ